MRSQRLLAALLTSALATVGMLAGTGTAAAADLPGGTLTPGTPVTATITRSTDNVVYTFAVTKGRHITFDATASAWDNNSPGQGNVFFILTDASGAQKKTCAFERPQYYCDITPDSTGTWKARLQPGVASHGTVTFLLAPDPLPVQVNPGQTVTTTVPYQGSRASYTFAATAGRAVVFDTSAANWTPGGAYLYFADPTGAAFGTQCLAGETFCRIVPNVTGTWSVAYIPAGGVTGRVTTLFDQDVVGPAITTGGAAVTTTIRAQGQDASYPWQATAGRATTVAASATSWTPGLFAYVSFVDAGGTVRFNCLLQNSPRSCTFTPATGGAWRIKVDPYGVATGSATFRVT